MSLPPLHIKVARNQYYRAKRFFQENPELMDRAQRNLIMTEIPNSKYLNTECWVSSYISCHFNISMRLLWLLDFPSCPRTETARAEGRKDKNTETLILLQYASRMWDDSWPVTIIFAQSIPNTQVKTRFSSNGVLL